MKKLIEVASLFFQMGWVAFGGPAAHIAMMEDIVVDRRKWMSRAHFLDLVGITHLIPGPNSTEMTMHCGYERAGIPGLIAGGVCFIFPAATITGFFAYLYINYGSLPVVEPFLWGIKPVVIALILHAVLKLGRKAVKNRALGILGIAVFALALGGISEIYVILGSGVLWCVYQLLFVGKSSNYGGMLPILLWLLPQNLIQTVSVWKLFLVFLKVGAILFGSGYVLFAYLDEELVTRLNWLTRSELLDAIAIGQLTPGPVLSTATFIGYQIAGLKGAVLATLGIFLPSFIYVGILNPFIPRMRESRVLAAFLDGVNVGAVGIMAAVMVELALEVITDWQAVSILGLGLIFTLSRWKISPILLVIGAAVLGYGLYEVLVL